MTQHLYLLRGPRPALAILVRRRPRALTILEEQGRAFVRFDGTDYLQYATTPFSPCAGRVRLQARLREPADGRTQVLFHTGLSVPGTGLGSSVNGFVINLTPNRRLAFAVQNQRYVLAEASVPLAPAAWGKWLEIEARWGGFNGSGGPPFVQISVNGRMQRLDDPAVFGEMGRDSQGLASRRQPRQFLIRHHTPLAFGGALQFPTPGMVGDLASIEVRCAHRKPWRVSFERGVGAETGDAPLTWRLHPVRLKAIRGHEAHLGAGRATVRVVALTPAVTCDRERVPYFPASLPGASVRHLMPGSEAASMRVTLRAKPAADTLGLLWMDRRSRAHIVRHEPDVELVLDGRRYRLAFPDAAAGERRAE